MRFGVNLPGPFSVSMGGRRRRRRGRAKRVVINQQATKAQKQAYDAMVAHCQQVDAQLAHMAVQLDRYQRENERLRSVLSEYHHREIAARPRLVGQPTPPS